MKLGFIGCGNMGFALAKGIVEHQVVERGDILVSERSEAARAHAKKELGVETISDNKDLVRRSDVIVMAIKPIYMEDAIEEIAESVEEDKIVVTLAPGKTLEWLDKTFGKPTKIVRTMPNTPALVGEGMTALCPNELVGEEELEKVARLFNSCGRTTVVPETMIDVVTGISGSSPAYVFMFIEALADAGVADGMPRAQAYEFAAQAVLGSAKMVLETGKHPGELKDMVCSPGGTTIEAVRVLEEKGLRSAVFEATKAAIQKAREL